MYYPEYDDYNPFENEELQTCTSCNRKDLYRCEFPKRKGKYVIKTCLSCIAKKRRDKRRQFKQQCVDYKGGCCIECGYNKCLDALEFHHLNPDEKDFMVSEVQHTSLEKVKDELDNCILLCSNHHREIHANIPLSKV